MYERAINPLERLRVPLPKGMIKTPLVSVVVTNYNYERFITECMESIAAQTYSRIEVFIVDDVSKDNSREVIRDFIASDERAGDWTLVALEQNGGQMNAFIEGFRLTRGAFVVFVDADDTIFPDFIETHIAAHLNTHTAVGLTCSNEAQIDQDGQLIAGTIENWHRSPGAKMRMSGDVLQAGTAIDDWMEDWSFAENSAVLRKREPLTYVDPADNIPQKWLWSTTSGMMFRRGALIPVLTDNVRHVRLCADYYLTNMVHMIGGTLLIHEPLGCYRRHGGNGFALGQIVGRGASHGTHPADQGPHLLTRLMQDEIFANWDDYVRVVGESKTLRMLSTILPIRRVPKVMVRIGFKPVQQLRFLFLFAIRHAKRRIREKRLELSFG